MARKKKKDVALTPFGRPADYAEFLSGKGGVEKWQPPNMVYLHNAGKQSPFFLSSAFYLCLQTSLSLVAATFSSPDARTGKLTWVDGERKNSTLFLLLIHRLVTVTYPHARRIHIILDNFKIHDSRQVQLALAAWEGKVKLHFLPPYCPDHNRIERLWKDLHDNVTRNHCCKTMEELMEDVYTYLRCRRRGKHCYPRRKTA